MKKLKEILVIMFISIFIVSLKGANGNTPTENPIHEGSVTLNSYEKYQEFVSHHYSRVNGSMTIYGIDELLNLEGLESLMYIDGHLSINNNPNLKDLRGLNSLKSVGTSLTIQNNETLISLEGLERLENQSELDDISLDKVNFIRRFRKP